MTYDIIIVGGGPAGLTAAKTAADDGLRVLLLERKDSITKFERGDTLVTCILNFNPKVEAPKYAYLEPISLEVGTEKTKVHFLGPGFSIDYSGPLRPYMSWICFSPSGYRIYKEKERIAAFYWNKEALLEGLRSSAENAGVDISTGTIALGAENTQHGVKLHTRHKSKEQTLESKKLIAADGWGSNIVDSLGFNKNRPNSPPVRVRVLGYIMEGIETDFRTNSLLEFSIPSINRVPFIMALREGDTNELQIGSIGDVSPAASLDAFMTYPAFAPWFRNARIIRKIAYGGRLGLQNTLIKEPAIGNVLIISDACGIEASNPGAIASGYQAAKATLKELQGGNGYQEFTAWHQGAFEGFLPSYHKSTANFVLLTSLCSDDEIDYLYGLFHDQRGYPARLIGQNLEMIKNDRPELYRKLKEQRIDEEIDKQKLDASDIW